MAEVIVSGSDPIPEEVLMERRPQQVNEAIRQLLREGTVADLCSERGQMLRMFFTESENQSAMYMPMTDCPGYDGVACDYCRGCHRFVNCAECHGVFDPTVQGWKNEPAFVPAPMKEPEDVKAKEGIFKRFLGRFGIR